MGSWVFHILILFRKHGKKLESFIFCGIKAQIFGHKKDIVSVPYLTVFGFLACNSIRILKSHGIVSLTLETSSKFVGDRPCRYLQISIAKL